MSAKVTVLGVDPGTLVTGFGLVEQTGGSAHLVEWSSIKTSSRVPLAERLSIIHAETVRLIRKHKPDEVAVENIFQARNVKSALLLGHARGVVLLAAAQAGVKVFEYAPREVKQSVVGSGGASKSQVAAMVERLLGVSCENMLEDETDAVAVALCHFHKRSAVASG